MYSYIHQLICPPKIGPPDKLAYYETGGQKHAEKDVYGRTDHSEAA